MCTCSQVYAGYNLRRDLSEAAKPASLNLDALSASASTLSREQIQQQHYADPVAAAAGSSQSSSSSSGRSSSSESSQGVPLELPLMRQAIAWQLCHRQLMHEQIGRAADVLKRELKADDVRDLQVRLYACVCLCEGSVCVLLIRLCVRHSNRIVCICGHAVRK